MTPPISPQNRGRYPADWPVIAKRIKAVRAEWRCECEGECGRDIHDPGRCQAVHGQPSRFNPASTVVLTVAHLDHNPENCADSNLKAMCQGCHLSYDADEHASNRLASAALKAKETGAVSLFDGLDV